MRVLRCPELIGRREVLARAQRHLTARTPEEPSGLTVLGPAGMGKSRLVLELTARARSEGLLVAVGRAVEGPGHAPLRPFAEALRSLARHPGGPAAVGNLPARRILARLVPEWADPDAPPATLPVLDIADAVLQLLSNLAEQQPALVVLEDLHWADPETLAVVEYLADNLNLPRLTLLTTSREGESADVDELLRRLDARGATEVLSLDRLDDRCVIEMAVACLGGIALPKQLSELLVSSAEGSPLLVEDLLATMAGSGVLAADDAGWHVAEDLPDAVIPVNFLETVRRRMRLLPDEVRRLLHVAALAGDFEESLLAEIVEVDLDEVSTALWAAYDVHLLETQGHGFTFRHQMTRHAVLALVSPLQRTRLAARTLEVIDRLHPDLEGQWVVRAAEAARLAQHGERAASLMVTAAARARAEGHLRTAIRYLDEALALPGLPEQPAQQVTGDLVVTLAAAGEATRAAALGESLLRDPAFTRRFDIHLALARVAVQAGDWALAARHVADAEEVQRDPTPGRRAALSLLDAAVALGTFDDVAAESLARSALRDAELAGDVDLQCEALERLGQAVRLRDVPASSAVFARERDLATQAARPLWQARALSELGFEDSLSLESTGRLQQALDMATRVGATSLTALTLFRLSVFHIWRHELERGVELAHEVQELAARHNLGSLLPMSFAAEAAAHGTGEDEASVGRLLEKAREAGPLTSLVEAMIHGAGHGVLALALDRRSEALEHYSRAHSIVLATPGTNTAPYLGLWALLTAVEGQDDVAEQDVLLKGAQAQRMNRGALHLVRAVRAGRRGDAEEALEQERLGSQLLERAPWHRQVLRRHVAEAAIDDGWGDPGASLREAAAWFDAHGHRTLADAARRLLRGAGLPVPRRRTDGMDVPPHLQGMGVTRREVEILRAVGEGLDNATIGARLFISPRTVEKHVENLQMKTAIPTRAQLVAFATRLDLPAPESAPGSAQSSQADRRD